MIGINPLSPGWEKGKKPQRAALGNVVIRGIIPFRWIFPGLFQLGKSWGETEKMGILD